MVGKTSRDETLLVKKCCRGNRRAQKMLYDRYSAKMMGVCYRYVHNRHDAEDVLQEGFIKVFSSLGQFKFKGSLEGWVRRIMVYTAINFLNKNKKNRQQYDVDEVVKKSVDTADMEMRKRDIMNMLAELPEGYRTVINLYAIEGYSHKEIGEMLDISEGTSRSQYSRGKKMLKEIQEKFERIRLSKSKESEQ